MHVDRNVWEENEELIMTDVQCWYCEQFSWHEWSLLNKTAGEVLKTDSRISCSKARYIQTTS